MDPANNHHHHHVVGSSSSSPPPPPSYYGVGTTTHAWSTSPTSFMNTNNGLMTSYPNSEPVLSSSEARFQEHTLQYNPDMTFHNWAYPISQSAGIKDEFSSDHYYRKYTDLLNESEQTKLLLKKSLSPENNNNNLMISKINADEANMISPGDHWLYNNSNSQLVFPSMNVSSLNQMEMNSEALDLLTSSSFSGNSGASSQSYNQIGILRDPSGLISDYRAFGDHAQQQSSNQVSFFDADKISSAPASHGSVETKRSSNKIEAKAPSQNATKKSRLEARGSCPPFKVRKEKLGDRIAALQQLVAPFGKTDTASVLMEAIGYIKFLQDQVETLSVPYMKASRNNKSNRVIKENEKDGEPKRDLKSRGLCLVPVSCLSYITDGGAAVVWPPPEFGGPA